MDRAIFDQIIRMLAVKLYGLCGQDAASADRQNQFDNKITL